jgi:hypothetical protein
MVNVLEELLHNYCIFIIIAYESQIDLPLHGCLKSDYFTSFILSKREALPSSKTSTVETVIVSLVTEILLKVGRPVCPNLPENNPK